MNEYKIRERDGVLTLLRRRMWFIWLPVEKRTCIYSQHRVAVVREWVRRYGIEGFRGSGHGQRGKTERQKVETDKTT